jgi:hypothetical protein
MLAAVRDLFVNDLNWVLVEDSIATDDLFVVRAQAAVGNINDRILLRIRYNALDYLAVTLCEGWNTGSPGSPDYTVQVVDDDNGPNQSYTNRFPADDILTDGGVLYVDSDDAAAEYVAISWYNDDDAAFEDCVFIAATCGIKSPGVPNYGVLAWYNGSNPTYLRGGNGCYWIPPRNHGGQPSNERLADGDTEPAAYWCHAPMGGFSGTTGDVATGVAGIWIDSATNARMLWPLSIMMSPVGLFGNRPAGTAMGYRGRLQGVMGYGRGFGPRTTVVDATTGTRVVVINTYPSENDPETPPLLYAVPAE